MSRWRLAAGTHCGEQRLYDEEYGPGNPHHPPNPVEWREDPIIERLIFQIDSLEWAKKNEKLVDKTLQGSRGTGVPHRQDGERETAGPIQSRVRGLLAKQAEIRSRKGTKGLT